jgi:hypothetical protein
VYSYGILLWECMTGEIPWGSVASPMQIIYYVGVMQQRPPMPQDCHPDLRALIQACWADSPQSRPCFAVVLTQLRAMQAVLEAAAAATPGARALLAPSESATGDLSACSESGIEPRGEAAPGSGHIAEAASLSSSGSHALHSYGSSTGARTQPLSLPGGPEGATLTGLEAAWL